MTLTNFPDGIFATPNLGSNGRDAFAGTSPTGVQNIFYVDNTQGNDENDGLSPKSPRATIQSAVTSCGVNGVIYVKGTATDYDESVTGVADGVSLIGIGFSESKTGWTADTDATCLSLSGAKGASVSGFLFRPDGATSGCAIDITEVTSNDTDGVKIFDNIFKSTGVDCAYHILANGAPSYVKIYNNQFTWGAIGINCTTVPIAVATGWEIVDNYFSDKVADYGIYIPLRRSLIKGNHFSTITVCISTLGYSAIGSYNDVNDNYLPGTWDTVGEATATDSWQGNYNNFAVNAANPT